MGDRSGCGHSKCVEPREINYVREYLLPEPFFREQNIHGEYLHSWLQSSFSPLFFHYVVVFRLAWSHLFFAKTQSEQCRERTESKGIHESQKAQARLVTPYHESTASLLGAPCTRNRKTESRRACWIVDGSRSTSKGNADETCRTFMK